MQALGCLIGVTIYAFTRTNAESSCGGYINVEHSTSGHLTTPNYPKNYVNRQHCIWLLVAEDITEHIHLTLKDLQGEGTEETKCLDFLEVRDGSADSALLYYGCNSTETITIDSTSRWMRIRFYSNDNETFRGFNATWKAIDGGFTNKTKNPVKSCPWTRYSCANKECISWSWVCDGWTDCGCLSGCDEDSCSGLGYHFKTMLAIGVGTGAVSFVIVIIIIVFWEWYIKNKAKAEEKKRKRIQKRYKSHSKNKIAKSVASISGSVSVADKMLSLYPMGRKISPYEVTSKENTKYETSASEDTEQTSTDL